MNQIVDKKLLTLLNYHKNEPIIFWGASLYLENFLKSHNLSNFNVKGIIDNNPDKIGSKICGYEILTPQSIQTLEKVSAICTIKNNSDNNYLKFVEKISSLNALGVKICPNIFANTNQLYLIDQNGNKTEVDKIPGLEINYYGHGALIEIEKNPLPTFNNCILNCNDNSYFKIEATSRKIKNTNFNLSQNSTITIGKNFSIGSGLISTNTSNNKITIGHNCMFSTNILIRTSDGHTVFDSKTKKILNHNEDVVIKDHVWLCEGARILKGTTINKDSIVGCNALVNKKFNETNVIIAGNPAKITKRNVNWDINDIENFHY